MGLLKRIKSRTMKLSPEDFSVPEETLQQWEDEFERGEWELDLEHAEVHPEYMKPPKGRPRILDEELVSVTFRAPKSEVEAIQAAAKREHKTFSAIMREALHRAFEQRAAVSTDAA